MEMLCFKSRMVMSVFTESAMSVSCVSVYLCVCAIVETRFPVNWRLLVKEPFANIGIPLDVSGFCCFNDFCVYKKIWVLGSLQTILLCIMGELAGEGSVDVDSF